MNVIFLFNNDIVSPFLIAFVCGAFGLITIKMFNKENICVQHTTIWYEQLSIINEHWYCIVHDAIY